MINFINPSVASQLLSRYPILQEVIVYLESTEQPLAVVFSAMCTSVDCLTCLPPLAAIATLVQHSILVSWGLKGHIMIHKNSNFSRENSYLCTLQHKRKRSATEHIKNLI